MIGVAGGFVEFDFDLVLAGAEADELSGAQAPAIGPIIHHEQGVEPEADAIIAAGVEAIVAGVEGEAAGPARGEIIAGDAGAVGAACAPIEVEGGVIAHEDGRAVEGAVGEILAAPFGDFGGRRGGGGGAQQGEEGAGLGGIVTRAHDDRHLFEGQPAFLVGEREVEGKAALGVDVGLGIEIGGRGLAGRGQVEDQAAAGGPVDAAEGDGGPCPALQGGDGESDGPGGGGGGDDGGGRGRRGSQGGR